MDDPPILRRVSSTDELVVTFDAIGRQFDPPFSAPDRRLDEPMARFDSDRALMLGVVTRSDVRGGAIAFRSKHGGIGLRAIGIDSPLRRRGIGRKLVET